LQSSRISFGDAPRNLSTDYRDNMQFDSKLARLAKRNLDPKLLKNLRNAQWTIGDGTKKPDYLTEKEFNNKKFVKDMQGEKRDLSKDYELQRKLKLRLSRNTFQIGNDQRYMY